ncbi:hypothetical protein WDV93_14025 [Pantoea ananatis]
MRAATSHRHANTRPMRIDGDGAIQWPCRCNHLAGAVASLLNGGLP